MPTVDDVCRNKAAIDVAMTGFRNVAIHEYRELDMSVLRAIAADRWTSLVDFCREIGLTIRP